MTEEILLLSGANGTELIRMMARFHKNSLGLRIMNPTEFARFALMRSGIILEESFLTRKQEAALIDGFVKKTPYFVSAGYADSEKIADALYQLRSLIAEKETEKIQAILPKGEFTDKNDGLWKVYEEYIKALKASKNTDTIGLLRKAMAEAKPLACKVSTLREYPLTPLEKAMLSRLAPEQVERSMPALLGVDPASLQNMDYTECYGASNEVQAIYDYIVSHQLPFDECVVAVANTNPYAQLFYDFSQSNNLPIAMGCGISIMNSNPARLLKLLYDWNASGYHGVDALGAMLRSDALNRKKLMDTLGIARTGQLNRVIKIAGQLRLDFVLEENARKVAALPPDKDNEDVYPSVAILAQELALGESKFLQKYALIRDSDQGRVDCSALTVICGALDAYAKFAEGSPLEQITTEILQRAVCAENSREGALFVTGISGAMASMRKHLFVVGMSASNFPGTPRENYLLLDSDYQLFAGEPFVEEEMLPTSANLMQKKKNMLTALLTLASALDVNVHISYSDYDLATLKEENPSSVLFDIFRQQNGDGATYEQYKKSFRQVGYFAGQVTGDHTIGRAYIAGKEVQGKNADLPEAFSPNPKQIAYAPTALEKFFQCPRKFFLTKLLGIREEETDDPFTVIDGKSLGTLAHTLMEELSETPCDRATFLQRADAAFDQFLLPRPPLHKEMAQREKMTFRKIMATAYDKDPGNEVLAAEEKQTFPHSSGILLEGYPDRVEKTPKGEYIIADYKTKKKIEHVENDIDTCLQVVIYAYMMEQKGVPITRCEYRYLRDGVTVGCQYDATMKEKLNGKLLMFKEALETGQFPCAPSENNCKYCTLANICGKDQQPEEGEAE